MLISSAYIKCDAVEGKRTDAQTFRIVPPMCVTKMEVDFAYEVFRAALIQHMERRAK